MAHAPIIRTLGKNGPKIPALGFGLMLIGAPAYGAVPQDKDRSAILDKALELGATFWDTSDLYGDNEELLRQWFQKTGKRDQIFLATKFGYVKGEGGKTMQFQFDTSYEYTKKACQSSLDAMGTDYIDLYYVHQVDNVTPIEETMRALAELQADGKIRHIGLSMVSSTTLRRAIKIAPVAAVQPEYSLFGREIEGPEGTDLLATCRELGVAVVCATPLGRGLLSSDFGSTSSSSSSTAEDGDTTKVDPADLRAKMMPRFLAENRAHNAAVVAKIREFAAEKKGCSVSQLALAWLLKQGDDIFVIPGTRRVRYLEENWATNSVELSDEEEKQLRHSAQTSELAGEALPEQFMDHKFRNTKEIS
ncbi:aldo-keto reductase [Apiospora phragmitis]|uniref:Aldo-keto reductase n=1 Tax=Apiospora phragmitis TaxID=2905665 RepID=A0ABR1T8M6_9PEZI